MMNAMHENVMKANFKLIDSVELVALMRRPWFKESFEKMQTTDERINFIIDFIEREEETYSIKSVISKILTEIEFDNDADKYARLRDIEIMEEGLFNV